MALQQRSRQLDVLRAVAILLVLLQHHGNPQSLTHRIGWTGVDLFFVLSGFLVSGLLFQELAHFGDVQVGRFLVRRGFKIYPTFWAMIATTVIVRSAFHEGFSGRALLCELLFLQNYGPGLWVPTWSLAVEEHFYLLLALGFFWFARSKKTIDDKRAFTWAAGLLATVFLLRIATQLLVPQRYKMTAWGTHVRIDSLAFGTLLSFLHHRHADALRSFVLRYRYWLGGVGAAMVLHVLFFDSTAMFVRTAGFTLLYLGYGALLLAALFTMKAVDPFSKLLATIGRSSYGIYLWHLPFQRLLVDKIVARGWIPYALSNNVVFFVVTSILAGIIITRIIERPFLRQRERIAPARSLDASVTLALARSA